MTPSAPASAPRVRGACPGVLDPVQTGDGWLLRIRLPGGVLSSVSMRAAAAVAGAVGSGAIDVTSRANLQIRGVQTDDVALAAQMLADAQLTSGDPTLDARRAVVASPLTGHDPAAGIDASSVVRQVVSSLEVDTAGPLPPKFGVVLDDGGSWPLDSVDGDVRLLGHGSQWSVFVRGRTEPLGVVSDPVRAVVSTARLCIAHEARLDAVVTTLGWGAVAEALDVTAGSAASRPPGSSPDRRVGTFAHIDHARCNVIALPFLGRLDETTLLAVADLGDRHRASIRLTPDHSLAFCGVQRARAVSLVAALSGLGMVVDVADPRSSTSACVGSAGCAWAAVDTSVEVMRVVRDTSSAPRFHVSGCAKGCGAPTGVQHLVADDMGRLR